MPRHAPLPPPLEPLTVGSRLHKELHLHLLELSSPENEVSRCNLVAKGLSDLSDTERNALSRGLQHVEIVHVDPLRRLRPEIYHGGRVFDRTHERLEHEVEQTRLGQGPAGSADRALRV